MNSATLGLVAAICWGLHDFIGRFAARHIGHLTTTIGLVLSGLVAVTLYGLYWGLSLPSTSTTLAYAAVAGIAYALATLCLFTAYRIGSMSVVSPIAGSYPAIAVVFGFFAGSRPSLAAFAAIAAVIAGSIVVSAAGKQHEAEGHIEAGMLGRVLLLSLACAVFFAVSLIAGQQAAPVAGEIETAWAARAFALAATLPFLVRSSLRGPAPVKWWPVLIVMGLLDTAAMIAIFAAGNLALPEMAIVLGGSFGALVTLLAWAILREPVSLAQWAGIGAICVGAGVLSAGY